MRRGWLWLGVAVCSAACADISGLDRLEIVDAQVTIDGDARADDVVLPSCGDAGVCVDVPPGYSVVDYAPAGQPECGPGSVNAQDVAANPQSATESCSCTPCQITPTLAPTCSCGADPAAFDIAWSTGTNCTLATTAEVLASTTCYVKTQSISAFASSFSLKPDAGCKPSGGACKKATPFGSSFTTTHDTGRRCDVPDASITTCAGGGSCVPSAGSGFSLCVTDGAMNACPSGFPTSHVVGASVVDTRSCNCASCTITSAGTCQTQVTFYSSNDCTTGSVKVPADGTCLKGSNNTSSSSASYASANNGAQCGGGAAYVDGDLSLAGSYRICCL